jgi:AbrB family looped-hinge helix DNA binding protein
MELMRSLWEKQINMNNHTNMKSVNYMTSEEETIVDELVAPRREKTKHIFGSVKVGERGQVVIPKEAREIFDIKPGDILLVLGDVERGIALVKADTLQEFAKKILESSVNPRDE